MRPVNRVNGRAGIPRPWGWELLWTLTPRYASRILHIRRGSEIELKYHRQVEESFFVRSGRLILVLEDANGELNEIWLEPGDSQHIAAGRRHRLIALEDCEVIEVSAPDPDLHSSAY